MITKRELLAASLALAAASRARAIQPAEPAPSALRPPAPAALTERPLWGPPYSRAELLDAQQRFAIRFPPDLFDFLLQRRFARAPDWTRDDAQIRELLAWPLEGILADVERNQFWARHWGMRPDKLEERLAKAEALVTAAPKLIPLVPNTYIPETPSEAGNPIFFVFLGDVRYRAANLADYVERLSNPAKRSGVISARKPIPFWTALSEQRAPPPRQPSKPAAPPKATEVPGERG